MYVFERVLKHRACGEQFIFHNIQEKLKQDLKNQKNMKKGIDIKN